MNVQAEEPCAVPLPKPYSEILLSSGAWYLDHSGLEKHFRHWWEHAQNGGNRHHELGSGVCFLVDRGGCGGWTAFTALLPHFIIKTVCGSVSPVLFLHCYDHGECYDHEKCYDDGNCFAAALWEALRNQFSADEEFQAHFHWTLPAQDTPARLCLLRMLKWLGNKQPVFVALWLDAVLLLPTRDAINELAFLKRLSVLDNVFLIVSCSNPAALCLLIAHIDSRAFSLAANFMPIDLSAMCIFTDGCETLLFDGSLSFPWKECLKLLRIRNLPITPALLMSVYKEHQELLRQPASTGAVDINVSFAAMLRTFQQQQRQRRDVFDRHVAFLDATELKSALSAWCMHAQVDVDSVSRYDLLLRCLFECFSDREGQLVIVGACGQSAVAHLQCMHEYSTEELLRASVSVLDLHEQTVLDNWVTSHLNQQSVSFKSLETALEWPLFRSLWQAKHSKLQHVQSKWLQQWPMYPGVEFVRDWLVQIAKNCDIGDLVGNAEQLRSLRQLLHSLCEKHFHSFC
eukprot:TRINITY_DN4783_c0_g1_i1.p1 TRINITY_DN4783_c0_g1~~TRINITY_DN4783_c0_g1_i1.p1  ORF type:complete len:514 (-),score=78.35 TRINITY_DN4783_c0_g1_i1:1190-2731(-)